MPLVPVLSLTDHWVMMIADTLLCANPSSQNEKQNGPFIPVSPGNPGYETHECVHYFWKPLDVYFGSSDNVCKFPLFQVDCLVQGHDNG